MATIGPLPLRGNCSCGVVAFQLIQAPLFIHCCHCTWCQRETGAAFALNALIETSCIELLEGQTQVRLTASDSGGGHAIVRCTECESPVWSFYGALEQNIAFVKVGALKDARTLRPDIHIFTSSKQDWVQLDPETPAVPEYYQRSKYWPAEHLARYKAAVRSNAR